MKHKTSSETPIVRHPMSRTRVRFETEGESKTHQSHAASCDVNNIIARYERTGVLPPTRAVGQFGDVTQYQGDLTDLVNRSREHQVQFVEDVNGYRKAKAEEARKTKESNLGTGTPPGSPVPPAGPSSGTPST